MSASVLDRAALYYPYIHIEPDKVNWLKATLLCFPQIRRMIPAGFPRNDAPEIQDFQREKNAHGDALLGDEELDMDVYNSTARLAQDRLLSKLEQHEDLILRRFSKKVTAKPYDYKIYRGKVHDGIWEFLLKHELGNVAEGSKENPFSFNVQPDLGEAIMSTIAIALARAKGLDIVTSDSEIHNALVIQSEDEVFDALLNLRAPRNDVSDAEKVDELAQVVIKTRFDVQRLTAAQIAELHKQGKNLIAFKQALMPIATQISSATDKGEREELFRRKANEVIEKWEGYKSGLPGFAMAALVEAQDTKPPEYAMSMIATGTAAWMPIVGIGIAVGVLAYKGYKIVKTFKEGTANPFNYLTQIQTNGAVLVGAPNLPGEVETN